MSRTGPVWFRPHWARSLFRLSSVQLRFLLLTLPALFACAAAPTDRDWRAPERRIGRVNTLVGGLAFDEVSDWEPADEQILFGFDWAERTTLPIMIEGGIHYSFEDVNYRDPFGDRVEVRQALWTFSFGALYSPFHDDTPVRPYIGAGGTIGRVDFSSEEDNGEPFEDRDSTLGGYFKAGVLLNLYPGGHVGLEYRLFQGREARINGVDLDPSYQALMLVIGTSVGY